VGGILPLRNNCLSKYCLNLVIYFTGGLGGLNWFKLSMPTLILSVGQLVGSLELPYFIE
jgi:hypothetical protein